MASEEEKLKLHQKLTASSACLRQILSSYEKNIY